MELHGTSWGQGVERQSTHMFSYSKQKPETWVKLRVSTEAELIFNFVNFVSVEKMGKKEKEDMVFGGTDNWKWLPLFLLRFPSISPFLHSITFSYASRNVLYMYWAKLCSGHMDK